MGFDIGVVAGVAVAVVGIGWIVDLPGAGIVALGFEVSRLAHSVE